MTAPPSESDLDLVDSALREYVELHRKPAKAETEPVMKAWERVRREVEEGMDVDEE